MHVIADRFQVAGITAIDHERFVTSAEEMPGELMPPIEATRIRAQEPFHSRHEIGLRRFHHEMKVVGHETISMHLPAGLDTRLRQSGKEPFTIPVVLEYRYAATTATQY